MRAKLFWAGIGVVSWIFLGMILSLIGGSVIGFSQIDGLIRFGAAIGLAIGLFYSGAALLTALLVHSRRVMPWMISSSLACAIVCFFIAIGLGGYPKHTQADLSFLLIAPVSIALGGLLGSGLGVAFWRSRMGV
ncbi:hypothetical protein [Leptolyngbya sp. FACHB-711]|uniref:hypothetical protein n=1 Tax=unclassified Leptolyngbya TaxID=2650499 RepID=UPI001685EF46|nr:hypothetical protein [Leptolyngbya sp. FACHB-711]MBD1849274.1 hypothetical protein [Cyanobacteria bacterium FACHB-502]MBD2026826.1 hypothetical protein [Leptolyngbya sp. FACHB-711]